MSTAEICDRADETAKILKTTPQTDKEPSHNALKDEAGIKLPLTTYNGEDEFKSVRLKKVDKAQKSAELPKITTGTVSQPVNKAQKSVESTKTTTSTVSQSVDKVQKSVESTKAITGTVPQPVDKVQKSVESTKTNTGTVPQPAIAAAARPILGTEAKKEEKKETETVRHSQEASTLLAKGASSLSAQSEVKSTLASETTNTTANIPSTVSTTAPEEDPTIKQSTVTSVKSPAVVKTKNEVAEVTKSLSEALKTSNQVEPKAAVAQNKASRKEVTETVEVFKPLESFSAPADGAEQQSKTTVPKFKPCNSSTRHKFIGQCRDIDVLLGFIASTKSFEDFEDLSEIQVKYG